VVFPISVGHPPRFSPFGGNSPDVTVIGAGLQIIEGNRESKMLPIGRDLNIIDLTVTVQILEGDEVFLCRRCK